MRNILLSLFPLLLIALPAFGCQGTAGRSFGAYGATTRAAVLESIKASEANPKAYNAWVENMVTGGYLVFVPKGSLLCVTDKADGLVRVLVKGRQIYVSATAVGRI